MPFLSICIPAYKKTHYLERLLISIAAQTFTDFEVIVTDDSPDDSVKHLCEQYSSSFALRYFKNEAVMGSPENWNEAIRKAEGQWIKMMHDDDWFASRIALEIFCDAIRSHPSKAFFFCSYYNVPENGQTRPVVLKLHKQFFLSNPIHLLSENVIGPPSVSIYKNVRGGTFDKGLKWLVDIDFYIRYLQKQKSFYINQCLINIGISSEQVTRSAFGVARVEIPEHFHVLNKLGRHCLKNIVIYDTFWRLMRNLNIKKEEAIKEAGYSGVIPDEIKMQLKFQSKVSNKLLHQGLFSKMLMAACYIYTNVTGLLYRRGPIT